METLLVPVDFSAVTERVIERAVALARACSSELHLLHVAAPEPDFVGYEPGPPSARDAVAAELRTEHRRLQDLAEGLRVGGLRVRAHLARGSTVETILAEARETRADLIVMGSHGRGPIGRALLGSVSEGVLRGAACPVLVVPAGPPR